MAGRWWRNGLMMAAAGLLALGPAIPTTLAHGPGSCCGGARPPAGTGATPGVPPTMIPPNLMRPQALPPGVREAIINAIGANRPPGRYSEIRQGHFVTDADLERMRNDHHQMQIAQVGIDQAAADNVRIFVVKHGANMFLVGVGFIIGGPVGAAATGLVYNITESAVETYTRSGSTDKTTHDAVAEFYAETAGQAAGQTPYVGPVAGPAVKYITKQNLGPLMDYEFRVDPANVDWQAGQDRMTGQGGGGPAGWRGPIK
ncbi:MAG: hypothetical protein H6907_15585 [Hyphomicrobiales bacterium]|nr:hypothetical protein [Hyphomicrobiales bacterium]